MPSTPDRDGNDLPAGVPNLATYKTLSTVASDGVFAFLNGSIVGGIWGIVSPFYPPGTPDAVVAARPSRPIFHRSILPSIGHNAMIFGGFFAVQRTTSSWVGLLRGKDDFINETVGFAALVPYFRYILWNGDKRYIAHNRALGGALTLSILYGLYLGETV
jgi:hypothetical protein